MSDRWEVVRRRAVELRAASRDQGPLSGKELVSAALRARGLEILPLPSGDPMLGGAKGVFDHEYVAYDRSLADHQVAFLLAHELGHAELHGDLCHCSESDLSDDPLINRLPYGAAAVETYNPRQLRELEASVFAAAFLVPPDELRQRFLSGASFDDLSRFFGVSPTATLNALAHLLLQPLPTVQDEPSPRYPLDASQQHAAEVTSGPVLVDAGPGTGKTNTLVGRILHLLKQGISPRHILAVTFSNRATAEMRQRLHSLDPEQIQQLTISTFHAFCLEVLRRYYDKAGLPPDFAIVDDVDAVVLLERNLARLELEHLLYLPRPAFYLKELVRAFGRAKDELVDSKQYADLIGAALASVSDGDEKARQVVAKWLEVARAYEVYESLLAEHGLIDFGGLIMRTVRLLEDYPDIREGLQWQYQQILVDEYQDMNRASAILLKLLAADGHGLWVVGDLRQAIYRFRGASPSNVTRFTSDYPGGQTFSLNVNYRCDPQLVTLLQALGKSMGTESRAPTWEAFWPGNAPPRVWLAEAETDVAEAEGIAAEILRRHHAGRPFAEQAILVRTHRQANVLVAALGCAGVPVLYLGDLFARSEVRDLLSLLSLVVEGNGHGLLRVGVMPEHDLPRNDVVRLIEYAREQDTPFPAALVLAGDAGLSPASVATATSLHATVAAIGWQVSPWQFLARYLFGHGALVRRLLREKSVESAQQLMALGQLLAVARAFDERPLDRDTDPRETLRTFLNHARHLVASGYDGLRTPPGVESLNAVRLLTVHAAKGLEFPVVYVTNLAMQRFPLRAMPDLVPTPPGLVNDESDQMDEETRLFFVALSRAQSELVLSFARRYGKTAYRPSPLLALIEPFFVGELAAMLYWPAGDVEAEQHRPTEAAARGYLDMAELELYLRCPRRYEYRYVLGLRDGSEMLGYKRLNDCVYRVLVEIRDRHRGGSLPDVAGCDALLAEEWNRSGPVGHVHEGLYRSVAAALVARCHDMLRAREPAMTWQDAIEVPLAGQTIRIRLDASEVLTDGTLRITRTRSGRPRDEDQRAPRLALVRSAAAAAVGDRNKVMLDLEYLTTGEVQTVKDGGKREAERIEKLVAAVEGIIGQRYLAAPKDAGDCATCPYWMICPA